MLDIQYSVITSDVIKSFDCIWLGYETDGVKKACCSVHHIILNHLKKK